MCTYMIMYIKCSIYALKMRKSSKFPLETLTRMYEKINTHKKKKKQQPKLFINKQIDYKYSPNKC